MLFKRQVLSIARGEITVAFRNWRRPTVKTGGRLRTPVGDLAIDLVAITTPEDITESQARAAGFADREDAVSVHSNGDAPLYRIEFRFEREDLHKTLANSDDLDAEAIDLIHASLMALDRRSREPAWTTTYLRLVHCHPRVAAARLASLADVEKARFKWRMRQLKELGLTQSLDVGYRLSPRGERYLLWQLAADKPAGGRNSEDGKLLLRIAEAAISMPSRAFGSTA